MTTEQDDAPPQPIKHVLIYANPSPASFDQAVADAYVDVAAANRQQVLVRDLYGMQFDPVLKHSERPTASEWRPEPDVAVELDHLAASEIVVLVYPIWFGMPPAIVKGYIDRVLGAGYSYTDLRDQTGQAAVKNKPLLTFSTSGTSLAWLHEQGQVQSIREVVDSYLWRGLGMSQSEHIMIDSVVPDMDANYAAQQLDRVRQTASKACAMLASGRYREAAAAAIARRGSQAL